jgi:hypothetical protein
MSYRARLIVAALMAAAIVFAPPAEARRGYAGAAIVGGLIGLGIGAAIAGSTPPPPVGYYPPPPAYYPPPPMYYGPPPAYYAPPPPAFYYGR